LGQFGNQCRVRIRPGWKERHMRVKIIIHPAPRRSAKR
jgi:hypothetical protein